jgi:hypothetical protein
MTAQRIDVEFGSPRCVRHVAEHDMERSHRVTGNGRNRRLTRR